MHEGSVKSLTHYSSNAVTAAVGVGVGVGGLGGRAPYLIDGRGLALVPPDGSPACCCTGDSCAAVADTFLEGVQGGRLVTTSTAAAGVFEPLCSVCCVPASGK